jgi:hypothetical protein
VHLAEIQVDSRIEQPAKHRVHDIDRKEVRVIARNADVSDSQFRLRRITLRDDVHTSQTIRR